METDKIEFRLIDWKTVKPLQGNLKKRSEADIEKQAKLLKEQGFRIPLKVWQNAEGEYFAIDGHCRLSALRLLSQTEPVPEKIPAVILQAADERAAKELILLDNSKFGEIDKGTFNSWLAVNDIIVDAKSLGIADIDTGFPPLENIVDNLDEEVIEKTENHCPHCGKLIKETFKKRKAKNDAEKQSFPFFAQRSEQNTSEP